MSGADQASTAGHPRMGEGWPSGSRSGDAARGCVNNRFHTRPPLLAGVSDAMNLSFADLRVKTVGQSQERQMAEPPNVVMNEKAGRFEIALDGETAFAEYRLHPGTITLPHTVVPEAFGGRGYAGVLAQHAFDYARQHGLKVIPTCPFMAGWVKKHPEAQDLVADQCKAELGLS